MTKMSSNLNNKNGRVSAYGFACGCVETAENEHKHVTIWAESGVYHVRWQLDKGEKFRYWEREGNDWETYERLADARKQYDKIARLVRAA